MTNYYGINGERMRALTVRQPWAAMLVAGEKTIELRSWPTEHRGDLLICASAADDDVWFADGDERLLLPAGAIVGVVHVIDCRPAVDTDKDAAMCDIPVGAYAWVIDPDKSYMTRPDKVLGRLKLFDIDDSSVVKLGEDDDWWNYPPPQGEKKLSKRSTIMG